MKVYNMLYILIILSVLCTIQVSAGTLTDPDDVYKLGVIDYKKPCINNGTYCSSSAVCNSTILYQNGSTFINNQLMTNNIAYHNITFTLSSCSSDCGIYKVDMVCKDGGLQAAETFYLEVNPTGIKSTDARSSALTRAIWIVFIIGIILFGAFLRFEHPTAKYSFAILSAIFILAGFNLVLSTLSSEVVDPRIISLFDFVSAASYYFYWLGAGLLMIILFVTSFNTLFDKYRKQKLVKYGD